MPTGANLKAADQRPWKGKAMEGRVARWYARTRRTDLAEFQAEAKSVAARVKKGSSVLEIAPGPGFFAIELAKLGDFRITGLDISQTFVEIARQNARTAGVDVEFLLGNASAMPFKDGSFDFAYCQAAFKNFTEPLDALNEMHRVLRPAGEALIIDLRRNAAPVDIERYVRRSGRGLLDAWITRWTFRHVLLKRAYTQNEFVQLAKQSRFGACQVELSGIGLQVRFTK